jgi:drug/metabolite transporter (DMT)-like permease
MQMMTGGGLLLLLGAATGRMPDPAAISAPSVVAMLFLTFVGSLVGFTCYLWLLGRVPPTQVATYAYVNPIVAVFLGWALAGEQLTAKSLAASVVVLAAVVTIVTPRRVGQADSLPLDAFSSASNAGRKPAWPISPVRPT